MAEALVFVVLQKIGAALGSEALNVIGSQLGKQTSYLLEVENNMRQLKIEFNVMEAFLIQRRIRSSQDTAYDAWLDEVKNVAHEAEDVIDEYVYLIGQTTKKTSKVKKLFHHFKNIDEWHSIAKKLKQIEGRLQKLTSMKDRYGISLSEKGGSNLGHESLQELTFDSAYFDTEDDIVGNKKESAQLTQLLMHGQESRTIFSIYGMAGVGKTTLARAVYKKSETKQYFNCFAWISISQSYTVEDLLKRILKELLTKEEIPDQIDNMGRVSLVDKIKGYLEAKRYLIVLDDMWSRDAWILLHRALVNNNKGSRVIITTRNDEVASLADEEEHRISLRVLGPKDAWDLFCKKAFRKLEGNICPPSLNHWAEKIVEKCEGLPLAIVAIGSLVSYKPLDEGEWRSFHSQLIWQIMNNTELKFVAKAINLSFDCLPSNLQNCFLYCGLFPEDYVFRRKELIRLWIAEGFVEKREGDTTTEEVAEEHLKELAQRSLLQVVGRNVSGRANRFQVHDLVRNITVTRCRNEKFSVLVDNPRVTKLGDDARRVSVLKGGEAVEVGVGAKNIRSFILLDRDVPCSWIQNASANFRLLRVLSLRFANIEKLPDAVTDLFNLHYLDLYYSKVKEIPRSVGRLRKLQMLDLRGTGVEELPDETKMLTKLRFLCVYVDLHTSNHRMFHLYKGVKVHSEICLLKDLQVLGTIEASNEMVSNLGKLTQLRCLRIKKVKLEYTKELWDSIALMPNLRRISVVSYDEDEVLSLEHLNPLPNLEWLHLGGKLQGGVVPSILSSFIKVRSLSLVWSRLPRDPLPSISQMVNLARLRLQRAFDGQLLTFRAGWFPKLKELHLYDLEQLSCIEIEDGTMQSLNYVGLLGLRNMTALPDGLRYLTSLQRIVHRDMPEEFERQLQQHGFHTRVSF